MAAVFTRQCRSRARGKQEKKKNNISGWKAFETQKELLRNEKNNTDNAVAVCNPLFRTNSNKWRRKYATTNNREIIYKAVTHPAKIAGSIPEEGGSIDGPMS